MNYIDKIKKNGIIYNIRGQGGGSSAGDETARSSLDYIPDDKAGFQVLDNFYGNGQINSINWNDQVCPLIASSPENDVSVYLGSNFEKTSDTEAEFSLILLLGGKILFDLPIYSWIDEMNSYFEFEGTLADKLNDIEFDYFMEIMNKYSQYWEEHADEGGEDYPIEDPGSVKGPMGKDDEEIFEPSIDSAAAFSVFFRIFSKLEQGGEDNPKGGNTKGGNTKVNSFNYISDYLWNVLFTPLQAFGNQALCMLAGLVWNNNSEAGPALE